mgnify:CR=1 FL=1
MNALVKHRCTEQEYLAFERASDTKHEYHDGEPDFLDSKQDALLNPTLTVAALSPTAEAVDRGTKQSGYLSLADLYAKVDFSAATEQDDTV